MQQGTNGGAGGGAPGPSSGPSRERFFAAYPGQAPWDIGRAQAVIVALADTGVIRGAVLDVGCGTGEHALLFAARGHEAWGVDMVPAAIERAREKADERRLDVRFEVADVLTPDPLGRTFDTVVDTGVFHVFADADRPRYLRTLETLLADGGTYVVLCFSDAQPGTEGPRRIREAELRETFGAPWQIRSLEPARFEDTMHDGGARAWLAVIDYPGADG